MSLRRQISITIGAQSMRFMWNNATRHGDISSRKPTLVEVEFGPAAMAGAASTPELHTLLPVNLAAQEGIGKSAEQSLLEVECCTIGDVEGESFHEKKYCVMDHSFGAFDMSKSDALAS